MQWKRPRTKWGYTIDGYPSYYHSGLTPPMNRVVQRRYLSRFEERDTKPVPPPKSQVSEVEKDLQGLIAKLSVKQKKGKKGSSSKTSSSTTKIIEEVEEEIVLRRLVGGCSQWMMPRCIQNGSFNQGRIKRNRGREAISGRRKVT